MIRKYRTRMGDDSITEAMVLTSESLGEMMAVCLSGWTIISRTREPLEVVIRGPRGPVKMGEGDAMVRSSVGWLPVGRTAFNMLYVEAD